MNIEHRTSNFELLRKHALEVIASVWLVLVAVQYLSRYFLGVNADLTFVYVGMLVLTIVAAFLKRSNGVVE